MAALAFPMSIQRTSVQRSARPWPSNDCHCHWHGLSTLRTLFSAGFMYRWETSYESFISAPRAEILMILDPLLWDSVTHLQQILVDSYELGWPRIQTPKSKWLDSEANLSMFWSFARERHSIPCSVTGFLGRVAWFSLGLSMGWSAGIPTFPPITYSIWMHLGYIPNFIHTQISYSSSVIYPILSPLYNHS